MNKLFPWISVGDSYNSAFTKNLFSWTSVRDSYNSAFTKDLFLGTFSASFTISLIKRTTDLELDVDFRYMLMGTVFLFLSAMVWYLAYFIYLFTVPELIREHDGIYSYIERIRESSDVTRIGESIEKPKEKLRRGQISLDWDRENLCRRWPFLLIIWVLKIIAALFYVIALFSFLISFQEVLQNLPLWDLL